MLFPYPILIPYNNTDKNILDYTLNSNQMDRFKTIYILIVSINILVAIFFILKFIIELKKYNATKNILNNKDINWHESSFNLIIEKHNLVHSFMMAIISLFVVIFLFILLHLF